MTNETVEGIRALVVPPKGDLRDVVLPATLGQQASALRTHIGCEYLEHVAGPDGTSLWVDEGGAICDPPRPLNPRVNVWLKVDDVVAGIHGHVVITGPIDVEHEDMTSLTLEQATALRQVMSA